MNMVKESNSLMKKLWNGTGKPQCRETQKLNAIWEPCMNMVKGLKNPMKKR